MLAVVSVPEEKPNPSPSHQAAVADLHEQPGSHKKATHIASRLPLRLLDEAIVHSARQMAVVYAANRCLRECRPASSLRSGY